MESNAFWNHRGTAAQAPADLVRSVDGGTSIRDGITFRLVRMTDQAAPADRLEEVEAETKAAEAPLTPNEIAPRSLPRHPRGAASYTLAPAATVEAIQLDLRALFPMDQPGQYRRDMSFDDLTTDIGKPAILSRAFQVTPKGAD
jgi:hypothetical protein